MARLSVFVACPYKLFPLEDYKKVFSDISRSYPVTFSFADEQITSQYILDKIAGYIRSNDISLFDVTGWNPNVSLELGIAVGMSKRYFILLNTRLDKTADVPSDIRGIDRVQYTSNSELEAKLLIIIKQEIGQFGSKSDSAYNSVKESILKTLSERPGLNIGQLAIETEEDKLLLQATVRSMVQTGDIKTTGAKKGTRYFTAQTDLRTVGRSIKKKGS